jgi:periplasmic divalent cation tolerance protein
VNTTTGTAAISCHIVLTTCPDITVSHDIARKIVQEKLAACVNILPQADSIYRWQGKVETAKEHVLMIKSQVSLFEQLQQRICDLHPYELPEIIAVPVSGGSETYLQWLSNPDTLND